MLPNLCKILGHKPIQPFPGMPAYCKRCLKDMSLKNGKYVVDEQAFDREFIKGFKLEGDVSDGKR